MNTIEGNSIVILVLRYFEIYFIAISSMYVLQIILYFDFAFRQFYPCFFMGRTSYLRGDDQSYDTYKCLAKYQWKHDLYEPCHYNFRKT